MTTFTSEKKSVFFLDKFALRQWNDPQFSGTRIQYDPQLFLEQIEEFHSKGAPLVPGYAPFCKHVFVPNFVSARVSALPISEQNKGLLLTGYQARTPSELPVLIRWFPADKVTVPLAKMLDVIVYSREQLEEEYRALDGRDPTAEKEALPAAEWGIISVKAQDEEEELPMQPITMMRNALGKAEGGSGVALDKEEYAKAVQYWQCHATVM